MERLKNFSAVWICITGCDGLYSSGSTCWLVRRFSPSTSLAFDVDCCEWKKCSLELGLQLWIFFHMHQNAWRAWGRGGRKITNRDSRDHGKMFTFSSTFENLQEVRPSLDMCLYCKWSEKDPAPMPEYASCVWISYSKSFSKFFRNRSDCGNWVMSCQALYLCHLNNPPKVVGPEGQFFAATWPG